MDNKFIEQLINKEFINLDFSIDSANKMAVSDYIIEEISKYYDNDEVLNMPASDQQLIFGHMAKWAVKEGCKLFKTPVPDEYYKFIIGLIIESTFNVAIITLRSKFQKLERLSLLKDEAKTSLLFGISVLFDEDRIDEDIYNESIEIIEKIK